MEDGLGGVFEENLTVAILQGKGRRETLLVSVVTAKRIASSVY